MKELYASAVRAANEKKRAIIFDEKEAEAMGGGFDIMKQLVKKLRTKKKKPQNKGYYTDGYDILENWQKEQTGKKFKETPISIKKEKKKSLMEPIEVNPPRQIIL